MIILSVDIAWVKPMAYAVHEDRSLRYYDKTESIEDLIKIKSDIIVAEDPYLGGDTIKYSYGRRIEGFKKLCYAVGLLYAVAQLTSAKVELVRPVDWKRHFDLTKSTSEKVQEVVRSYLTKVNDDIDIQDAILIGKYYIWKIMITEEEYLLED